MTRTNKKYVEIRNFDICIFSAKYWHANFLASRHSGHFACIRYGNNGNNVQNA